MDGALPVLICGAGPTGLALALELSRFGVPCRIVDRASAPAAHSGAFAVQARTLELLEAARVTERLLMFAHPLRRLEIAAAGRPVVSIDFAGMPTPYPFLASVGQETLERTMIVCLHEQGLLVERGVSVTAVTQHDDAVDVELAGNGETERVRCRYLAACDGAHSTVRRLLDAAVAAHAQPERFALADVRLATETPRDRLMLHVGRDGDALALVPLGDGWRTIVETRGALAAEPDREEVQRALDAHGIPATVTALEWSSTYEVQPRKIERYALGRVFFLGDAAHVHTPFGAQGMNAGVGDAVNLAWKLALVVNDSVDPKILATYHDEREPIEANTTVRALHHVLAPLMTRLGRVRDRLRENLAGLRIAYPRSPLSVNDVPSRPGVRAGMRVRGHRPAGYRPQPLLVEGRGGTPTTIVVRPDGYAGYVADGAHAGGASTYLRNVIGLVAVRAG